MDNWEAIAALSELVAAAAVIISVVYLAVQIRNNTKEIRASSFNAVTDSFNQFNFLVARDTQVAKLWHRGSLAYEDLNDVEKRQYDLLILGLFRIHESVYYQSNRGTMEQDLRDAENRSLFSLLGEAGMRHWWKQNPYSMTNEFRDYVEEIIARIEVARS